MNTQTETHLTQAYLYDTTFGVCLELLQLHFDFKQPHWHNIIPGVVCILV